MFDISTPYETASDWYEAVKDSSYQSYKKDILETLHNEQRELSRSFIQQELFGGNRKIRDSLEDLLEESDLVYERQVLPRFEPQKTSALMYGITADEAIQEWYRD